VRQIILAMSGEIPPVNRIRIGVSRCLLGERVRYDGDHRRNAFITDTFGAVFEYVAVCPEVEVGMGIPRPPIHLVGKPNSPKALGFDDSSLDVTAVLTAYGRRMALEMDDISGYIFKSGSPSCGPGRVKVFGAAGASSANGVGLYAREIMTRQPLLPVVEDSLLVDPAAQDNFIERVFAYRRWRQLLASGFTAAKLAEFHSVHKLCLMAHGAVYYRALGRLAAEGQGRRPDQLIEEYGAGFMAALKHPATRKRHANVLQHLVGYLKKHLDHADKVEMLELIDTYRLAGVSLIAPLTLLRHHFRRFPHPYVEKQLYLYPEPEEMRLRNG
jgi:uncharacterized protein YbgA (DUF1722 family)/uncharacterized protein YbbK (DUF523 family)